MIISPKQIEYKSYIPYISEETVMYHYDKHHMGYVNQYTKLVHNTHFEKMPIDNVLTVISEEIRNGDNSNIALFNNGAQVWNHNFYWDSITLCRTNNLEDASILSKAKSCNNFRSSFIEAGTKHFGSGWLWIVRINSDDIDLITTKNADSPLYYLDHSYQSFIHKVSIEECKPLWVCDLWEHAYYIDYRNNKLKYLENSFDFLLK